MQTGIGYNVVGSGSSIFWRMWRSVAFCLRDGDGKWSAKMLDGIFLLFLDCLSSLQDNKDIIITWCGDLKVLFHFQLCAGFHQYSLFWVDVAHREVIMVDYTSVLIGHYVEGQRASFVCFFLHRSQRSCYALHYLSQNYICTFTNLIANLNGDVLVV